MYLIHKLRSFDTAAFRITFAALFSGLHTLSLINITDEHTFENVLQKINFRCSKLSREHLPVWIPGACNRNSQTNICEIVCAEVDSMTEFKRLQ